MGIFFSCSKLFGKIYPCGLIRLFEYFASDEWTCLYIREIYIYWFYEKVENNSTTRYSYSS